MYKGHVAFSENEEKQMQFMCLIYSTEGTGPQPGTPEWGPFMQGYMDFTAKMKADGKLVAGDALQGIETSTTVTVRGGNSVTTDGPFAETKEQLGGYYLLECDDLDEALKYAAMIPTAAYGRVEVRPIVVFDM
jgi:hypothetical protein